MPLYGYINTAIPLYPEAPMGQLPFLEVASVKLVESCAIIRYLGRELGLYTLYMEASS